MNSTQPDPPTLALEPDLLESDAPAFVMVPEWVLDLPMSDGALRLYTVLARFANRQEGRVCFPARATLARLCRCSADTVDRRKAELVEHGAIAVRQRRIDGNRNATNVYRVRFAPAATARPTPEQGKDANGQVGPGPHQRGPLGRTHAAENQKNLEPKNTTTDQSQAPGRRSRKEPDPINARANQLARWWWDQQRVKPSNFPAVLKLIAASIKQNPALTDDDYRRALAKIDGTIAGWQLVNALLDKGPRGSTSPGAGSDYMTDYYNSGAYRPPTA